MLRIATTGTGVRGLQVVEDDGLVKEVGDEGDDDVLEDIVGKEPGYYTEDWVFVRSLDSETVIPTGGQRAHDEVEPGHQAMDRGVRDHEHAAHDRILPRRSKRRRPRQQPERRSGGGRY